MLLSTVDRSNRRKGRLAVLFNRSWTSQTFLLPGERASWRRLTVGGTEKIETQVIVPQRSVVFYLET
jgi:glycogen operon protein